MLTHIYFVGLVFLLLLFFWFARYFTFWFPSRVQIELHSVYQFISHRDGTKIELIKHMRIKKVGSRKHTRALQSQ